jgi:polysaccharide biosynthesis transport protein
MRASPDLQPESSSASNGFDIKRFYHTVVERLWLVLTCAVLAALGTAGYIQRQTTLYSASAVVQVEQEEARVVKVEKIQQEDLRWLDALRTIEQTFKSRAVLERVVENLKLAEEPSFLPADLPRTKENLIAILDKTLSVRLRKGTRLLDVTATHSNPQLTARIANAVVTEYVAHSYDQNAAVAEEATSFLNKEGRRLKTKLDEAERALQEFRDRAKSVSLEERNDIVTARLKELNAKLTEANSTTIRLKTELAQLENVGNSVESLLVVSSVNADPSVAEAKSALSRLEGEFAKLKQRYKDAHPKYVQMQSEIATWRKNLERAALKVPQSLRAAYEGAVAAERALQTELARQEEAARQLTKDLTEYTRLSREVDSNRALYEAVQTRLKEAALTRDLKPNTVQLRDQALVPSTPVWPRKTSLLIRGILGGIVLGILLAVGLNTLDSSIKTVDEAEEYLQLPVLSAVPKVKTDTVLVVANDAKCPASEAFRTLRTSVSMLGRAENRRTFLFTSAVPAEGKTFCSINFSLSLAQQGLTTLLIDGDLRRPAVEKALYPDGPRRIGVTDYLTGQKEFKEIVRQHEHENFFYIPAGTVAPNPAELIAQGGFDELIEEALLHYDRVVVDSAPVHAVSDTLLMTGKIKTVSLVVRAGSTPRKAVGRAVEMLRKAGAPLAGVILNRQQRRRFAAGYDPYYTYSYTEKYSEKGVYGS